MKIDGGLSAKERSAYPFHKSSALLYLGEIDNMPGHCAVVDIDTGKVYAGYHSDIFIEIPEDEL